MVKHFLERVGYRHCTGTLPVCRWEIGVLQANSGVVINLRVQNEFHGGRKFGVGRVRDLDTRKHVVATI